MTKKSRSIPKRVEDISQTICRRLRKMSTTCVRCRRLELECEIDVKAGRCTECAGQHKTCNLQVPFQEFQRMAALREKLERQMEEAEQELSDAEEWAEEARTKAHNAEEGAKKARVKVRRLRKVYRRAETTEAKAIEQEIADIAEASRKEGYQEEPSPPPAQTMPSTISLPYEGPLGMQPFLLPPEILENMDPVLFDSYSVEELNPGAGNTPVSGPSN